MMTESTAPRPKDARKSRGKLTHIDGVLRRRNQRKTGLRKNEVIENPNTPRNKITGKNAEACERNSTHDISGKKPQPRIWNAQNKRLLFAKPNP
jgi:hypothetical protein